MKVITSDSQKTSVLLPTQLTQLYTRLDGGAIVNRQFEADLGEAYRSGEFDRHIVAQKADLVLINPAREGYQPVRPMTLGDETPSKLLTPSQEKKRIDRMYRGSLCHKAIADLLTGTTPHIDEVILPWWGSISGFVGAVVESKAKILLSEQPLIHADLRYGGTPDLILEWPGDLWSDCYGEAIARLEKFTLEKSLTEVA